MNEAKVRVMAEQIKELMALHGRQKECYMKLLRLCLKHLTDRRRFIPKEVWAEREQLIAAVTVLTGVNQ